MASVPWTPSCPLPQAPLGLARRQWGPHTKFKVTWTWPLPTLPSPRAKFKLCPSWAAGRAQVQGAGTGQAPTDPQEGCPQGLLLHQPPPRLGGATCWADSADDSDTPVDTWVASGRVGSPHLSTSEKACVGV